MKYLSVCSGIDAASVAWEPLGWEPIGFSEIEAFPSAVLAARYPHTPNFGDMTKYADWSINPGSVDVLIGGTPCQSFSVAGMRGGIADPRGNLALVYLGLIDKFKPRWVVWENVPGVLSSGSGRDFGAFLGGLTELGYGFAYRVMDAQYFGVAQRRRRVFVIGCANGKWQSAADVIFQEYQQMRNYPARKGSQVIEDSCESGGCSYGKQWPTAVAATLDLEMSMARGQQNQNIFGSCSHFVPGIVPEQMPSFTEPDRVGVRCLTPIECERLQGFPDNYTLIQYRGKPAGDRPRYKALGNSMAVPVINWIGRRIQLTTPMR